MLDWLFSEPEENKTSLPQYREEKWPFLMVPHGKGDRLELQFQQSGVEDYKGPMTDSHLTQAPPILDIFYFETEDKLKKATYVAWKSSVEVEAVDLGKMRGILNEAPEIYEYLDDTVEVEIV